MDWQVILLIFIFSVGASFVQRVSGFGFGIFIMTILPHIMPSYGEATTLSGILSLVVAIRVLFFSGIGKHLEWRKGIIIMLTFFVVSWCAIQFVSIAGGHLMKRILGAALIFTSLWFLVFSKHVKVKPTPAVQLGMGTISGIMGGLFGMPGPAAVLYFLACTDTKERYQALTQTYFLLGNIVMTIYRAQKGFVTPTVGYAFCVGVVALLIGVWLGDKVFNRISTNTMRQICYIYMAVSGFIALIS